PITSTKTVTKMKPKAAERFLLNIDVINAE
ncbi:MAG: hypothetical protein RLY46_317, partial [Bacteroidota bacterium]